MNQQIILAVIIGLVAGALFVWLLNRSARNEADAAEGKLQKLQKEFDAYRNEVNAHFAKTADAVDQLTQSYQNVFNHLSDGAQKLMDKTALKAQLEKRQGKAVTLAYLVDESGEKAPTQVPAERVVSTPAAKADAAPAAAAAKPAEADKDGKPGAKTLHYPASEGAASAAQSAQKSTEDNSRVLAYPAAGNGVEKPAADQAAVADKAAPVANKAAPAAAKAEAAAVAKAAAEPVAEAPKKRSVEIAAENAGIPVRHKEGDAGETSLEAVKRHLREQQGDTAQK